MNTVVIPYSSIRQISEKEPPYFELYGNDCQYKIIFDSTGLFANKKNSRQFHELQNIIQNFSYGTRDMT